MQSRPRPSRASDAPTEPLAPGTVVTEEYDVAQEPAPPEPPPPVRRAWADELGWALLALLVLVVAGVAIWWFVVHNGTAKRTVPAVTGQPVSAAVDALQSRGFRVQIFSRPHSTRPGTVFQETPPAGTRVAKGSTVQLLSSAGPSAVTVPNAVGLSEAAGRDRLVSAGFKVTETRVFDQQRAGQVISQTPAAGSKVAKGASVAISVSKGTGIVIVPNVVGQSLRDAETALAKAGLKPNVQLRVPSAQPAGTVVAQNPPGGQAKRDSTVQLNVSTGTGSGSSSGGTTGVTGATGATGTG